MKSNTLVLICLIVLLLNPGLKSIHSQDFEQRMENINSILSNAPYLAVYFGTETEYRYTFSLNTKSEIVIAENSIQENLLSIKKYFFSKNELMTSLVAVENFTEYFTVKLTSISSTNTENYIRYKLDKPDGSQYNGQELVAYIYYSNLDVSQVNDLKYKIEDLFSLFLSLEQDLYQYSENTDYEDHYNEYEQNYDDYNYSNDHENYDYGGHKNSEKIEYYNEEKQRVYGDTPAAYYRKVTYDKYGMPIGETVCYYISGEVYFRGQIYRTDGSDFNDDEYNGQCTWFFKNGKKRSECYYNYGQEDGVKKYWYKDGKKYAEFHFNNGILDGPFVMYHKNGKIEKKGEFINGELKGRRYIECDELDICQYVFQESFDDNENGWPESSSSSIYSSVEDGMYYLKSSDGTSYIRTIDYNIDQSNSYIIEASIYFIQGTEDYGHGLVWGFKNSDNYFSFEISCDGYYTIQSVFDGLKLEIVEWTKSSHIKKLKAWNRLQINKYGDEIYFSINGNIVHDDDYRKFRGSDVGIISRGIKSFYVDDFIIREYIGGEGKHDGDRHEAWTGSGTGVVITTDGYIVTNYHVVEDANEISVELYKKDFRFAYNAEIQVYDKGLDLAILKISDPDFEPYYYIPFTINLTQLDVGTRVFALGYPLTALIGDEIRFNEGTVSSSSGIQGDQSTYQVSVPVQPGNSGSPLFDYNGNLVGIVSSKIMQADNISYAIKSRYIRTLLNRLATAPELAVYNNLEGAELTYQIKILKEYVPIIKVR